MHKKLFPLQYRIEVEVGMEMGGGAGVTGLLEASEGGGQKVFM